MTNFVKNEHSFNTSLYMFSQSMIFPGQLQGRLQVTPDATLKIIDVRDEDAGHYICRGIGGKGMPKARAYLRVIRRC